MKTRVLLVLCMAEILGNSVKFNFSAVLTVVKHDWEMSHAQCGLVISGLQIGYVLAVIFIGRLADRFGARNVFAISAMSAGVINGMFGLLSDGFASAFILRCLTGAALAGVYVPGMKMVAEWFPPRERGQAMGVFVGAVVLGSASSFLLGPLVQAAGWRNSVLLTSVGCFLSASLVWLLVGKNPDYTAQLATPDVGLLKQRPLNLVNIGYMSHMWELYGVWGWIAPFTISSLLATSGSLEYASSVGGMVAFLIMAAGGVSNGVAGAISDRLGRTRTVMLFTLVSASGSFVIGFLHSAPLFLLGTFGLIYGFFLIGDSSVLSTAVTELSPPCQIGSALAVQSFLGFSAAIVSPTVFGLLLDRYGWSVAFAGLGMGALVGTVAMAYLRTLPQSEQLANGKK